MKKITTLVLLLISFSFVASAQKANLITSQSFDKITKTATYKDLQKLYGVSNVQDAEEDGAEGTEQIKVTKIFKDKKNEIIVFWDEKNFHKKIASVETYQDGSPYYTADSLKRGSTLKQLLQANGKKINFSGLDWDYGGFISSYNKGKFAKSNISFKLGTIGDGDVSNKVMGDIQLNTDMPAVKKNLAKIKVIDITVDFIQVK